MDADHGSSMASNGLSGQSTTTKEVRRRDGYEEQLRARLYLSTKHQRHKSSPTGRLQAWTGNDLTARRLPSLVKRLVKPSAPSAPQITCRIKYATSVLDIEEILEQHGSSFNHIHASAALIQFTRFVTSDDEVRRNSNSRTSTSDSSYDATLLGYTSILSGQPQGGTPGNGTGLAVSPSQLGVFDQLLDICRSCSSSFDPQAVSNVLYALAVLDRYDGVIVEQAIQVGYTKMDEFNAQNLANTIWALGRLQCQPATKFLARFYKNCLVKLKTFNSQDLANLFWGVGKLELKPKIVKKLLLGSIQLLPSCSTQHLANIVYGLGAMGHSKPPPEWLSRFFSVSYPLLPQMLPEELTMILWGLGKVGCTAPQVWLKAAHEQVSRFLPYMPNVGLCNALYGMARMDKPLQHDWLGDFCATVRPRLPLLPPESVASIMTSLGHLEGNVDGNWIGELMAVVESRAEEFSHGEAVGVLWALARLDVMPPSLWLGRMLSRVLAELPSTRPGTVVVVLYSLAKLRIVPEEAWLRDVLEHCKTCLDRWSLQEIACCVWSLAILGCHPGKSWLKLCTSQVQGLLQPRGGGDVPPWELRRLKKYVLLSPISVNMLLYAYARFDVMPPHPMMRALLSPLEALESMYRAQLLAEDAKKIAMQNLQHREIRLDRPYAPGEVANLFWALSKLSYRPSAKVISVCLSWPYGFVPGFFSSGEVIRLMYGLGQLGICPSNDWANELAVVASQRYRQMSTWELAAFGRSMGRFRRCMSPGWEEGYLKAVEACLPSCSPRELVMLGQAVLTARCRPSSLWYTSYEAHAAKVMDSLDEAERTHLAQNKEVLKSWVIDESGHPPVQQLDQLEAQMQVEQPSSSNGSVLDDEDVEPEGVIRQSFAERGPLELVTGDSSTTSELAAQPGSSFPNNRGELGRAEQLEDSLGSGTDIHQQYGEDRNLHVSLNVENGGCSADSVPRSGEDPSTSSGVIGGRTDIQWPVRVDEPGAVITNRQDVAGGGTEASVSEVGDPGVADAIVDDLSRTVAAPVKVVGEISINGRGRSAGEGQQEHVHEDVRVTAGTYVEVVD